MQVGQFYAGCLFLFVVQATNGKNVEDKSQSQTDDTQKIEIPNLNLNFTFEKSASNKTLQLLEPNIRISCLQPNLIPNFETFRLTQIITNELFNFMREIVLHFHSTTKSSLETMSSGDIFQSLKKLQKSLTDLNDLQANLTLIATNEPVELGQFVRNFHSGLESLGYRIPSKLTHNTLDLLQCLNRLSLSSIDASEWLHLLNPTLQIIQNENVWYDFLVNLMEDLTDSQIHIDNKWNLKDWWGKLTPQKVSLSNFDEFWTHFGQVPTLWHRDLDSIRLSMEFNGQIKMAALNELLETTLESQLTIDRGSDQSRLIVQGNFVVLSNVLAELTSSTKSLVVLASHTIFVDVDVISADLRPLDSLTIISPNWWIDETRVFDLDGVKGPSTLNDTRKLSGKRGEPGLPGENGGHFFGLGERIQGDRLIISADGGRGGPGESGQDGADGRNGADVDLDFVKCSAWPSSSRNKLIQIDQSPFGHIEQNGFGCHEDICGRYLFKGEVGTFGHPGGDGGKGGHGGHKGTILMRNVFEKILTREPTDGESGIDGEGGNGGNGGWTGRSIAMSIRSKFSMKTAQFVCKYKDRQILERIPGVKGHPGQAGGNERSRQEVLVSKFKFSSNAEHVNMFKQRALTQIHSNKFLRGTLHQFLDKTNRDEVISSVYDPASLFDEFAMLDTLSLIQSSIQKPDFLLPTFESLLQRTHLMTLQPNDQETLKSLAFLYSTILSRICSIKATSDPFLVINIQGSLSQILSTVNSLKNELSDAERNKIVQIQKTQYENQVNQKMAEANHFIREVIQPEVERIHERIERNVEKLVEEILVLRKKVGSDLVKMMRAEEELQLQVRLSATFGILKTVSQCLGFLGPEGAILGIVIDKGLRTAESFLPSGTLKPEDQFLKEIPVAIKNLHEALEKELKGYMTLRLNSFHDQIKEIQNILATQKDVDLSDVILEVNKIEEEVKVGSIKLDQNEKPRTGDFDALESPHSTEIFMLKSEKKLNATLEKKEKSLQSEIERTTGKKESILTALQKIGQAIRVMEVGAESYRKFKGDREKLDIMSKQVRKGKVQLDKIQGQLKAVYDILTPMVQKMREDLRDFQERLVNQSGVGLDVSRWQVTKTLRDLKDIIRRSFTQEFQVDQDMIRCFDLIGEAMTTLINIFDRILRFGEQAEFANFMAALSSASVGNVEVKDLALKEATSKLEMTLQSNLILKGYEEALRSFRMWVFPLASFYLDDVQLPQNFSEGPPPSVSELALAVGGTVEKLIQKLGYYKDRVGPYDQFLHHKAFYPTNVSQSGSFFVWTNEEFGPSIRRLLLGQKVMMRAGVEKSPVNMNAIKFRSLELGFRMENEELERELWGHLRRFKVNMAHSGNSYYRFGDEVHVITSRQLSLSFSFETHNGLPAERNEVYEKLRGGDLVLSPYTMWEIQLQPMDSGREGQGSFSYFEDIRRLSEHSIDMELNGEGTYVSDGMDVDPLSKSLYGGP